MNSPNDYEYIPYSCQEIDQSDINSVIRVLKSDYLTQGPLLQQFESAIASKVQAKFSVAVNSATSALHLACMALSLKRSDWIWTSSTSFVASANCALYCGAKVDFVDINPSTGLMSTEYLENKLITAKKENKLPKILIVVHLAGTSCEMESINKLSKKYGFYIIEDASHALGGKYNGNYVGSCEYSSITVFSFHPVKIITTGEGGCLTTNDKKLAEKLFDLRSHGITKDPSRFIDKDSSPWHYEQQGLGFNYRMTDIQAALGLSQLKKLDNFVQKRNFLLNEYKKLVRDLPINFLSIPPNVYSSVHLAVINLNIPNKELHLKLFNYLRANNVGVQIHYIPIHLQPFYKKLGFKEGDFPNSELYALNAISLPLFTKMCKKSVEVIVDLIKKFFEYETKL